tara:strand:- start:3 stop:524 length:522 start_codon:yes stop_codon:yes gene_type:complete
MKRLYLIFFWSIILTSLSNSIDYNYSEYYQNNSSTYEGEANGNFVTLSSDNEGGMVGLELDCCTTGEIIGLVLIIAIFVGIPSFWVFRKLWKFGEKILFAKIKEEDKENENIEVDELLGSHLPLTLKELKIKKKRTRIEMGLEEEKPSFNFKEEFVIFSVFLFIIYLFWNNGI